MRIDDILSKVGPIEPATGDALDRFAEAVGLRRRWLPVSPRAWMGECDTELRARIMARMSLVMGDEPPWVSAFREWIAKLKISRFGPRAEWDRDIDPDWLKAYRLAFKAGFKAGQQRAAQKAARGPGA
jgi:hypothetical protein